MDGEGYPRLSSILYMLLTENSNTSQLKECPLCNFDLEDYHYYFSCALRQLLYMKMLQPLHGENNVYCGPWHS